MIYCTRKILISKYNKHKELTFRSLKNYSVDIYKQALERDSFPNYENFDNTDIAYNDFISRLNYAVNAVAPLITVRVLKTTQARGLVEKLQIRYIGVINTAKDSSGQNYVLMKKSIRKHET